MSGSNAWVYATRTIPAWSVCFIAILLVFSFLIRPYGQGDPGHRDGSATPWQIILSIYTVVLHILSVIFPARVCYALGDVMQRMKETATLKDTPKKRRTQSIKTPAGSIAFPLPLFVIILPAYKEEMSTLDQTLRVLASHPQARHAYHVRSVLRIARWLGIGRHWPAYASSDLAEHQTGS